MTKRQTIGWGALVFLCCFLGGPEAGAQEPTLSPLPLASWKACLKKHPRCPRSPRLRVARWFLGKKAASSLTFDDSLPTQYRLLVPLLAEFGLKGTFFLTTVDLEKKKRTVWGQSLACWPRWKAVAAAGHEIGSHTVKHPNLSTIPPKEAEEELRDSCATIRRRLGGIRCDTLAYPYGISTPRIRRTLAPRFYMAARGAGHSISPASPKDFYNVPSVTPYTRTSMRQIQGWLQTTLQKGLWLVWMLHGTQGQGWEALPLPTFRKIFALLKGAEKRLWIAPFGDVARYIRLRQALRFSLAADASERGLSFRLENPLPADLSHPVTLRLAFPSAWSAFRLSVRGQSVPSASIRLTTLPGCPCLREVSFEADPLPGLIALEPLPSAAP